MVLFLLSVPCVVLAMDTDTHLLTEKEKQNIERLAKLLVQQKQLVCQMKEEYRPHGTDVDQGGVHFGQLVEDGRRSKIVGLMTQYQENKKELIREFTKFKEQEKHDEQELAMLLRQQKNK